MTLFAFALWCLVLCIALCVSALLLDMASSSQYVKVQSLASRMAEYVITPLIILSGICGGLGAVVTPGAIISFFIN